MSRKSRDADPSRDDHKQEDGVMKLRPIVLTKRAENVICYSLAAITSPAWAIVAALVALLWVKRKLIGPGPEWGSWFAWYPVRVRWDDWRWLEIVERRSSYLMGDSEYRTPERTMAGEKR